MRARRRGAAGTAALSMAGALPHPVSVRGAALAAAAAVCVVACASPTEVTTPYEIPAAFSEPGTAPAAERWWQDLADPRVDALIDEALAGNLGLQTAWDRLAQAQSLARREGSLLFPSVVATTSRSVSSPPGRSTSSDACALRATPRGSMRPPAQRICAPSRWHSRRASPPPGTSWSSSGASTSCSTSRSPPTRASRSSSPCASAWAR